MGKKRTDYSAVWKRNSEMTKGMSLSFINLHTGVKAFTALAEEISEKQLPEWAWKTVLPVWISYGKYSREDNATFIKERFGEFPSCVQLSEVLLESSAKFGEIMQLLESEQMSPAEYKNQFPALLMQIARIEERISELLKNMNA